MFIYINSIVFRFKYLLHTAGICCWIKVTVQIRNCFKCFLLMYISVFVDLSFGYCMLNCISYQHGQLEIWRVEKEYIKSGLAPVV